MKIRIKRFEKDLPLPQYHTEGAAGFDLAAAERVEILPGKTGYVFLNVAVEIPEGYFLLLASRSSLHKKGLMMANSIGVVDSDYRGDDDQVRVTLFNFSDVAVVVERGDRIVQGIITPFVRAKWEEVEKMDNRTRGGFGSTGEK